MPDLFKNALPYVGVEPFENDLFERKALAERLTGYIDRLNEGCVIGIHANWGEGKSWFGRNWHAQLVRRGYPAIYVDAFQNDFMEDAFLLIASEIISISKETSTKATLTEKAKAVGKNILPAGAKAVISAAGKALIGAEASEEFADALKGIPDDFGKAAEKYIERQLKNHDLTQKSIASFRETLKEFSSKQEHPLVFFIDELDRCKPTFAVQIIERIKHFFDVPNLIFVLLLNRSQLEAAIQGVYGAIDPHIYLGKFIHFYLTLPKVSGTQATTQDHNRLYLRKIASRCGYVGNDDISNFIEAVTIFAGVFGLSLRDLERAFIYYGLSNVKSASTYAGYLIALKIAKPDIFDLLAKNDRRGHELALEAIPVPSSNSGGRDWLFGTLRALHMATMGGVHLDDATQQLLIHPRNISHSLSGGPEGLIRFVISRIDIQVAV